MRHYETIWDGFRTLWDVLRHYETLWDMMRHFMTLVQLFYYETFWDMLRYLKILWDILRHYETWWDIVRHWEKRIKKKRLSSWNRLQDCLKIGFLVHKTLTETIKSIFVCATQIMCWRQNSVPFSSALFSVQLSTEIQVICKLYLQ